MYHAASKNIMNLSSINNGNQNLRYICDESVDESLHLVP